jgi:O-antigen ligase
MKNNILRILDVSIPAVAALTICASLFYPPYASQALAFVYKSALLAAGLLFIIRRGLSKEAAAKTPLDVPLFLILCWTSVSALFSISRTASIFSTASFALFILVYYLVFNYAEKFYKIFLYLLTAAASLICLYGLYQYFFGFNDTLNYLYSHNMGNMTAVVERLKSGRIFSTFIYPDAFAGFLILIIPIIAGLALSEKKYRLPMLAAAALMIINLFLTKSIGAFISLVAAFFLTLFFIKNIPFKKFIPAFILTAAAGTVLLFALFKMRGTGVFAAEMHQKMAAYLKMFYIIKKYPVFGSGPGTFEIIYNSNPADIWNHLKYAHNFILQTAVETGLAGLGLLLAAIAAGYAAIARNISSMEWPGKITAFSILCGITAFIIHNLADFDVYNFELGLLFTAMTAVLMRLISLPQRKYDGAGGDKGSA